MSSSLLSESVARRAAFPIIRPDRILLHFGKAKVLSSRCVNHEFGCQTPMISLEFGSVLFSPRQDRILKQRYSKTMSSIYGGLNTYATFALDLTCSPPPSLGGLGFCGPSFCSKATSSMPTCVFTSTARNYASEVAKNTCRTCTQSTDARCTTAALKALVYGQGIKAAFCNDNFLVISTGTSFPVAEIQHEQITKLVSNNPPFFYISPFRHDERLQQLVAERAEPPGVRR